jgi:membrane protein required for colicin V production
VAHVLLFLATAIALSIFARLFTKLLRAIHLSWANRLFGGIFGILKYGIIVLALIFVMDRTNQAFHYLDESPIVKTSIIYPYGVKMVNSIIQETETITTTTTTTTTTTITR